MPLNAAQYITVCLTTKLPFVVKLSTVCILLLRNSVEIQLIIAAISGCDSYPWIIMVLGPALTHTVSVSGYRFNLLHIEYRQETHTPHSPISFRESQTWTCIYEAQTRIWQIRLSGAVYNFNGFTEVDECSKWRFYLRAFPDRELKPQSPE